MEVCQGGNHKIYTLIDPLVTTEMWMRTTAGNRADNPTVSMEFPPHSIIYSEVIFQENSQPARKNAFNKITFKGWWNNRISRPQRTGGQAFLLGYPICMFE